MSSVTEEGIWAEKPGFDIVSLLWDDKTTDSAAKVYNADRMDAFHEKLKVEIDRSMQWLAYIDALKLTGGIAEIKGWKEKAEKWDELHRQYDALCTKHDRYVFETNKKIEAIKKYIDHPFFRFYKAMIHEYERHDAEKGASWKNCTLDYLTEQLNKVGYNYFKNTANDNELIDMANMEAMIWLRLQHNLDELEKILEAEGR